MRIFLRLMLCLGLLLPLAGAATLWLALEPTPRTPQAAEVSVADIGRAKWLLQRNDPRGALPGIRRLVVLSQRDLELLANQAGRRLGEVEVRARVRLQPGVALLQASLALPPSVLGDALKHSLGGWLNVNAVLHQTDGLPQVERLHIGRLRVPGWLAEAALPPLLQALNLRAQGELAQKLVSHVAFAPQQVLLAYAWPHNLQQELADTLMPPEDQARLKLYADRLVALSAELQAGGSAPVSMARLLPPMFALARQRSPDAAAAQRENRAALLALAFLVNGKGLSALLPTARQWPQARPLRVLLHQRQDTPQHFLVSAALAAEGGGPLADVIGLYKEVADSQGGSGFSFNDLAADRAGTRFGLLAARQPLALQARLADGVQEQDLLPPVADLPEAMNQREFQRRFGGVGAPAYRQMMVEIEARLDRLALLAKPG